MIDLKNYICSLPFTNLELHDRDNFMCCPSWLLKKLPGQVPLNQIWNSEESIEIRKSIMDGSYRHCDKTQCPYLSQLLKYDGAGFVGPIFSKDELPKYISENYDSDTGVMNVGPKIVQMSFDRTCNLSCPSCRVTLYTGDSAKIKKVNMTIEEIERDLSDNLEWLYITGSGDPFVSVGFRNFLKNFDSKKFPKLKNIHLHTNATRWNKNMWNEMKNVHKYVKTCEISIDAATKDTYENITRIGGDWDLLMDNLQFINTIPDLKYVKTSFVVQSSNYKEMKPFLNMMKSIFGKKSHIFYGKINNWGTFNDEEFKKLKIWDEKHPEYDDFVKEFNEVCYDDQVFHNMHEFIRKPSKLI